MDYSEAIEQLKSDIDKLTTCHATLLRGLEMLNGQLEIARHNLQILQDAFIAKKAIPIGRN